MTVYEFTKALFDEAQFPKRMTIETAAEDIRNFRLEGWELPEDITPESYRDEWNSFLPESMYFRYYGVLEWLEPDQFYAEPWKCLDFVEGDDQQMYEIVTKGDCPCEFRYTIV